MSSKFVVFFLLTIIVFSCTNDKNPVNPPPTDTERKKISGKVALPPNTPISSQNLKIITPFSLSQISSDGTFSAEISQSDKPQIVFASTTQNNPVLLGYIMPNSTRINLNDTTTATTLALLSPWLIGSVGEQRIQFMKLFKQHNRFPELVELVKTSLQNEPQNILSPNNQRLFELVIEISTDVLQQYSEISGINKPGWDSKARIEEENGPLVRGKAGDEIEFVNDRFVYYVAGIFQNGEQKGTKIIPKIQIFKLNILPPDFGFQEDEIVTYKPGIGTFSIGITKGRIDRIDFINQSLSQIDNQAFLINMLYGTLSIVDLFWDIGQVKNYIKADKLNCLLSMNPPLNDLFGAFANQDYIQALNILSKHILQNGANYAQCIFDLKEQAKAFLTNLSQVVGALGVIMKIVGAIDKVGFFYSWISSSVPIYKEYIVTQNANGVDEVSPAGTFPEVQITSPQQGDVFNERIITVSGTVGDNQIQSATLDLNGLQSMVSVFNGEFNQSISLFSGENRIRVIASNPYGSDEDEVTVTCTITPAKLRAQLSWDTDGTDVDLWVIEPDGFKVFWASKFSPSGGFLDVDDRNGFGPENYNHSDPPDGIYTIAVHYYSDNGYGPSNAKVEVYLDEKLERVFGPTLMYDNDLWNVCQVEMPSGKITTVNSFGKINTGSLPSKK